MTEHFAVLVVHVLLWFITVIGIERLVKINMLTFYGARDNHLEFCKPWWPELLHGMAGRNLLQKPVSHMHQCASGSVACSVFLACVCCYTCWNIAVVSFNHVLAVIQDDVTGSMFSYIAWQVAALSDYKHFVCTELYCVNLKQRHDGRRFATSERERIRRSAQSL